MKKVILFCFAITLILFSCQGENDILSTDKQISRVSMDISGLKALGDSAWYELWVIWLEKTPTGETETIQSIGVFSVDNQGLPSQSTFDVNLGYLQGALNFMLTIESDEVPGERYSMGQEGDSTFIDTVFAPSNFKILAGKVYANAAELRLGDELILDYDFNQISGSFMLNTPSDTTFTHPESGVWFVGRDSTGKMIKGLNLPVIPSNWNYEAWVTVDGQPLSLGSFKDPGARDASNPYADTLGTIYTYPGEDFLTNAPDDLSFPLDLRGKEIYVTMTPPHPKNSNSPFDLIPVSAVIPQDAAPNTVYEMDVNTGTFPFGDLSIMITLFE